MQPILEDAAKKRQNFFEMPQLWESEIERGFSYVKVVVVGENKERILATFGPQNRKMIPWWLSTFFDMMSWNEKKMSLLKFNNIRLFVLSM